jgi:hypothetical protein
MPSFSKNLWFQCQAFPKNVLGVLWDFNGLWILQIQSLHSSKFLRSRSAHEPYFPRPTWVAGLSREHSSAILFFRKIKFTSRILT